MSNGFQSGAAQALREEMVQVGRLMYERGLVVANDGNLSARLDEAHVLCTPSGLCKGAMAPAAVSTKPTSTQTKAHSQDAQVYLGRLKKILAEVQSGEFAREWILENRAGRPVFNALARQQKNHLIEQVGAKLRSMMSWLK